MKKTETPAKKVEEKVADTILQRAQSVTIGSATYEVAPPTIGTLVIVSEHVCSLPVFDEDKTRYFMETLAKAKDCRSIAYAVAALILGSKHWDDPCEERRRFPFSLLRRRGRPLLKRDQLAEEILNSVSPREIGDLLITLLNTMEIADFFATTIFLGGVHLTKPTKIDTNQTALGR